MPLVTALVGAYNQERWVLEALKSIQAQEFDDLELIIADDNSSDMTPSIIQSWLDDNQISGTFIRNYVNKGICETLNEAMPYITGKYVTMLACDDVWVASKTRKQVDYLNEHPETAMVFSNAEQIDNDGNSFSKSFLETYLGSTECPEDIFLALCKHNFIPSSSVMIRADILSDVGPWDESLIVEDHDMWLRISKNHRVDYIDDILSKYRRVKRTFVDKSISTLGMAESCIEKERKMLDSIIRTCEKHKGYSVEADNALDECIDFHTNWFGNVEKYASEHVAYDNNNS